MRALHLMLAGLIAVVGIASPTQAQGVGFGLAPAAPEGPSAFAVSPQAGPWMILAASYGGTSARAQADELANEIRNRYRLPAYVFDRTAEAKRAEDERVERIKEMQRQRFKAEGLPPPKSLWVKRVKIEDQYAVLVGGYKDDTTARKELDRIRTLKPSANLMQTAYVPDPKTKKMHEEAVNPFQSAFVCRNPTVPIEKPAQDVDLGARLKEYNRDESYSLLSCRKQFTLVVKAYKAPATIQSQTASTSIMEKLTGGKKSGDILNANARQAHQIAEFLRKVGCEAYALHTEYNSYVTIGGFDSVDDPRLVQMQRWFVGEISNPKSTIGQLHTAAMVQFLSDPMPMPVPQVK